MNLALSVAAVLHDRMDVRWSLRPHVDSAYLGWTNRGNLGDEAMFHAARVTSGSEMRRVPLHAPGRALAVRGRCRVLVVGGGTLLGRPEWLERAVAARKLLRPDRTIVLGTGVEPLEFGSLRGTTDPRTAAATAEFLRKCDFVGVRGPRSLEELNRHDVAATVIGDPALALRPSRRHEPAGGVIAVNLAAVTNGEDQSRERTTREVLNAAHLFAKEGRRVMFFAMERVDEHHIRDLTRGRYEVLPWADDVGRLIRFLDDADAVLSERLHGGILAAARGTPFIQIGYKPKIHDFAESIGASSLVVTPRNLDGHDLAKRVKEAADGGLPEIVSHAVEALSDTYRKAVSEQVGHPLDQPNLRHHFGEASNDR